MVVFGKEACHLEFVHDSEAGSLTIYAIQFHPKETLMKLPMPSIRVKAKTEDAEHVLECQAVVNPTFGNTAERSSEYAAQAEWLKTPTAFEGEVFSSSSRVVRSFQIRLSNFQKAHKLSP